MRQRIMPSSRCDQSFEKRPCVLVLPTWRADNMRGRHPNLPLQAQSQTCARWVFTVYKDHAFSDNMSATRLNPRCCLYSCSATLWSFTPRSKPDRICISRPNAGHMQPTAIWLQPARAQLQESLDVHPSQRPTNRIQRSLHLQTRPSPPSLSVAEQSVTHSPLEIILCEVDR